MLYAQLDVNWPENPKRIRAGLEASALHAIALCIAKRTETDGWMERITLSLYGGTDELIDRLVDLALLDAEGDKVRPHDWHEKNLSSEAIRRKKSDSARAANHARWHDGPLATCEKCEQIARSSEVDPTRIPNGSVVIPEVKLETSQQQTPDPTQLILRAARIVAEERAIGRDVGEGSIVNATKGIADDHRSALLAHLEANPEATPLELAEVIEPTKRTPQKTGGVIVDDEGNVFLPGTGWCSRVNA